MVLAREETTLVGFRKADLTRRRNYFRCVFLTRRMGIDAAWWQLAKRAT
jgi:hypothetical protein